MNITSSLINLEVSDGSMAAFVSRPKDDESHPAIIVIQEIFGVNANIRKITETFAAQGYISVAPDLFHRSGSLLDIPYSEMDTARGLAGSTTPDSLISDLETVVRHLQADPFALQGKLGITGYCFGGRVSLAIPLTLPICRLKFLGKAAKCSCSDLGNSKSIAIP